MRRKQTRRREKYRIWSTFSNRDMKSWDRVLEADLSLSLSAVSVSYLPSLMFILSLLITSHVCQHCVSRVTPLAKTLISFCMWSPLFTFLQSCASVYTEKKGVVFFFLSFFVVTSEASNFFRVNYSLANSSNAVLFCFK